MLHGSETWLVRKENGVELRERLGIDDICSVLQQNGLQYYGYGKLIRIPAIVVLHHLYACRR